jgi:hypothetical protein
MVITCHRKCPLSMIIITSIINATKRDIWRNFTRTFFYRSFNQHVMYLRLAWLQLAPLINLGLTA